MAIGQPDPAKLMMALIPPSPSGTALSSRGGSIPHEAGECKPCLFVNSKLGCANGARCMFCHLRHRRVRHRAPRNAREEARKLAAAAAQARQLAAGMA